MFTKNAFPRSGPSSSRQRYTDFETAIAACNFGRFNIYLLIASMSTAISVLCTTSSLSFILPIAEYDLHLTLMDKGYLNAMSFAGMIFSAIPWGYIADTMGRKVVMVYALIFDGIIVMGTGISQNTTQLLVLKFLDGFLICGPFAVVMTYVAEFHGIKHRAHSLMVVGMNFSAASAVLALLALFILPHKIFCEVLNIQINNWHIFLLATSVVPFFGGICNSFFPESPKFLMAQGRNDEALESFRTIYAINNRKPKSEYPIINLIDEDPEKTQYNLVHSSPEYKATHNSLSDKYHDAKEQFVEGLHQLRPIFSRPYLGRSLYVYFIFFCILLGLNSLRLWLPQIFVTLEEFEAKNIADVTMCTILSYNHNKTVLIHLQNYTIDYDLEHITVNSYIDNIYVAITSFLLYALAISVINKLGSKLLLKIVLLLGFFSGTLLYFSKYRLTILILSSIYVGVVCVAGTAILYASVNLFPTQMRAMVVILMMTFGRLGSLSGNILFPLLVSYGCIPPFLQIGGVIIVSFILCLFLPNATNIPLK